MKMRIRGNRWHNLLTFLNTSQRRTIDEKADLSTIPKLWEEYDEDEKRNYPYVHEEAEEVRLVLVKCVEVISKAKRDRIKARKITKGRQKIEEWERKRSKRVFHEVNKLWNMNLFGSLAPSIVTLKFDEDPWEKLSEADINLFQEEVPPIEADSKYERFIIQFLEMISDPAVGPTRIFRCPSCGKTQIGRRGQIYCASDNTGNRTSKCRSVYHNSRRSPEQKREAVQKSRATPWPIHSPIAKKKKQKRVTDDSGSRRKTRKKKGST